MFNKCFQKQKKERIQKNNLYDLYKIRFSKIKINYTYIPTIPI